MFEQQALEGHGASLLDYAYFGYANMAYKRERRQNSPLP